MLVRWGVRVVKVGVDIVVRVGDEGSERASLRG